MPEANSKTLGGWKRTSKSSVNQNSTTARSLVIGIRSPLWQQLVFMKNAVQGVCFKWCYRCLKESERKCKCLCSKNQAAPRAHEGALNLGVEINTVTCYLSNLAWHSGKSVGPLVYEVCDLEWTKDLTSLIFCCLNQHGRDVQKTDTFGKMFTTIIVTFGVSSYLQSLKKSFKAGFLSFLAESNSIQLRVHKLSQRCWRSVTKTQGLIKLGAI